MPPVDGESETVRANARIAPRGGAFSCTSVASVVGSGEHGESDVASVVGSGEHGESDVASVVGSADGEDHGGTVRADARTSPQGPASQSQSGFTLLEVLIAVAILSMSLTSLLSSQMSAMRSTRYARDVSVAAFLAEAKLLDLETDMLIEGWGTADKSFEGDFSDEGWPEIRYECLVDFIEIPEFSALQQAKDGADTDGDFGSGAQVADAGDQAFAGMGMVWPIIKGAIEQAIRKSSCKVIWTDGAIAQDFTVETYWTDVKQLMQLPQAGGEVDETDDTDPEGDGADPSGRGGTGTKPGAAPTTTPSGGGANPPGGRPSGPAGGIR